MKPMLACSTIPAVEELNYPVLASPKLDGIRCLIVDGKPVTRSLKPIPNNVIRNALMGIPYGLDGELMLKTGNFNTVQSAVMSEGGWPSFVYMVFDLWDCDKNSYEDRIDSLRRVVEAMAPTTPIEVVPTFLINNAEEMAAKYKEWLDAGYEGAIVRDPKGPYKHGRSTLKQGWMLKLKVFNDAEAEIIDAEELMHNDNVAELDNLGYMRRSSHMAHQVPGGTLGALVCKYKGEIFKIGSGFSSQERSKLWTMYQHGNLTGKLVTFKYQEISEYGKPRFPVYKGLRDARDTN